MALALPVCRPLAPTRPARHDLRAHRPSNPGDTLKIYKLLAATFAALVPVLAVQAQAPTMEQVNTTLPEEGAPKAVPGPYAVSIEAAHGNAALRVYRPTDLSPFPARDALPVVVWGHGGCAMENRRSDGFLSTIASHGFLVITTASAAPATAPGSAPAGPPQRATADHLIAGVDWAQKENARDGAPLKGRVDMTHVAVMGQSCGGTLSITAGADARVATIGVFNSGIRTSDDAAANAEAIAPLKKLHGPVLLINGHDRDFATPLSLATFNAINNLPVFYGARHGAGHTATLYHVGGGEYANVASNWVLWQFKADAKASRMFSGPQCELCVDSNWDTDAKRLSN